MTNEEIYKWLKEQNYQTEQGEQEYTMYFDVDMPKILTAFVQEHNARLLSEAGVPSDYMKKLVHKIAYEQWGEEQGDDFMAKCGMLHEFLSALLLKEREEKDREMEAFAEWCSSSGWECMGDYKWTRRIPGNEDNEFETTAQLLAQFRERVEKGEGA